MLLNHCYLNFDLSYGINYALFLVSHNTRIDLHVPSLLYVEIDRVLKFFEVQILLVAY